MRSVPRKAGRGVEGTLGNGADPVSLEETDKEKEARAGRQPAGPWPMQLRYQTGLTGEQYVSAEAWRAATLAPCPNHPDGGCSFARHGTYERRTPAGTLIARWYCPESHQTFSLLPDCLAARLPGTLRRLEEVVVHAEQAPSLMKAADEIRRDEVRLPGAMRWVRRRVILVQHVLRLVIGLLPQLAGCRAEITACRARLGTDAVLVRLRSMTDRWLATLAAPLGFHPHGITGGHPKFGRQHHPGPSGVAADP